MAEEFAELIRKKMETAGAETAIDYRENVAHAIHKCITEGLGLPMFHTRYGNMRFVGPDGKPMVLMMCWGGEKGGSVWFKDVPIDDVNRMERATGDWKWIVEKYGTKEQLVALSPEVLKEWAEKRIPVLVSARDLTSDEMNLLQVIRTEIIEPLARGEDVRKYDINFKFIRDRLNTWLEKGHLSSSAKDPKNPNSNPYEFMSAVPPSVMVEGKYIADDETIFSVSIRELLLWLKNDREFYETTTKAQMEKSLRRYLDDAIETLKQDYNWYVEKAMPKFLAVDFMQFGKAERTISKRDNPSDLQAMLRDAIKDEADAQIHYLKMMGLLYDYPDHVDEIWRIRQDEARHQEKLQTMVSELYPEYDGTEVFSMREKNTDMGKIDYRQAVDDQMIFTIIQEGDKPEIEVAMSRSKALQRLEQMRYPLDELRKAIEENGAEIINTNVGIDWARFSKGLGNFMLISTKLPTYSSVWENLSEDERHEVLRKARIPKADIEQLQKLPWASVFERIPSPSFIASLKWEISRLMYEAPEDISPKEIKGFGEGILSQKGNGKLTWKYNRFGHVEIWKGSEMRGESDLYLQTDYDVGHFFYLIGLSTDPEQIGAPEDIGIDDWDTVDDPGYFESTRTPQEVETTDVGCKLTRGFSPAGWFGKELDLFASLIKKGFTELYYSAPYHWGVINIPEKKVFTYTEGDTALIECDTPERLVKEAQAHIDFLKEMGYSKASYGEWEELKKKLPKVSTKTVEVPNIKIPVVFEEYVAQFVVPYLGRKPNEEELRYFRAFWDEVNKGVKVGYSELAMHYGIAGKAIKEVRWRSPRWVEVFVEGKWWEGLPQELLPHELRKPPEGISQRISPQIRPPERPFRPPFPTLRGVISIPMVKPFWEGIEIPTALKKYEEATGKFKEVYVIYSPSGIRIWAERPIAGISSKEQPEYRWEYLWAGQGHYFIAPDFPEAVEEAQKYVERDVVVVQEWKPKGEKWALLPQSMSNWKKSQVIEHYVKEGYDKKLLEKALEDAKIITTITDDSDVYKEVANWWNSMSVPKRREWLKQQGIETYYGQFTFAKIPPVALQWIVNAYKQSKGR